MIRLYEERGCLEIDLLDESYREEEWLKFRNNVCRLLRVRGLDHAAEVLESVPFRLHNGTNVFGDQFHVLVDNASPEKYVDFTEEYLNADRKLLYRQIAKAFAELGIHVRFITIALDMNQGPAPVSRPNLITTSDAVERALTETERLIHSSGAPSSVDRIHTALHAYLGMIAEKAGIAVSPDADITHLFKAIRQNHPRLMPSGPRTDDIDKILRAMASVVDSLNPLRNKASMAHPTEALLGDPEAMLVVNSVRSMLHYLSAKLG